jgi:RNA polymerase sigma-70 factor (ECF subfamily)
MAQDKDFELVKEFTAGNEAAFNTLVGKYQQRIYWHARRMVGDHLEADEVTQEVLIVLYKKLKTFKFNSNLFTWIYRITSNLSINHLRKNSVRKFLRIDDESVRELKSNNSDLVNDIENKEKLNKLDNVLNKLPVKQREVFILRNFEELSYEEISEITGKSVGGLKANYFHALKKVTELMENE